MTLTQAITRSINVVPVKLSIALGQKGKAPNPAKLGRAKITEVARRFGLKAPLPDTPSLPIGSDEVTVLEHAVAYATFPNRGKAGDAALRCWKCAPAPVIWSGAWTATARSRDRRSRPPSPPTWPA